MNFKILLLIQGFFNILISLFETFLRGPCSCKRRLKVNRKLLKDESISFLSISRIVFQSVCRSWKSNKASFKFLKLCLNKFGLLLCTFMSFCNRQNSNVLRIKLVQTQ